MKIKLLIITLFVYLSTYSQLLPDSNVIFKNFNGYSVVGENLFGKILKTGEANTSIYVSSIGITTFFSFESTLFGGGQDFKVSNVNKELIKGKLICNVEAYDAQDTNSNNKIFNFIFEYFENKLIRVFLLTEKGALEVY